MPAKAAALVVRSVSPASGAIGAEVMITGAGFAGVTGVRFGAVPGEFSVKSGSQVAATVPAGASSGPVTVTGPRGTASGPRPFTVTPGILVGLQPPAARQVTVTGAGFGAHEAVDIYIGDAEAALASTSGTGNFAGIAVPIPAAAAAGTAYLTAVGRHSGLSAQAQFAIRNTVTVTSPGDQVGFAGEPVGLQIQASDSAGQTLTYAATQLPPGLGIDPVRGLINGIPNVPGNFDVTVTASDTTGASGSAAFGWIVQGLARSTWHHAAPGPDPGRGRRHAPVVRVAHGQQVHDRDGTARCGTRPSASIAAP